MDLREIYSLNNMNSGVYSPKISFEISVPVDGDVYTLFEQLRALKKYNPVLVSLSIGKNSQMQGLSIELLQMVQDLELCVLPNLTTVCASKELVEHYITKIENLGIENVLILENGSSIDFKNDCELIDFVHQKSTLAIGIKENIKDFDIENLKNKLIAGASVIFTENIVDNEDFFMFVNLLKAAGINVPVVASVADNKKQCLELLQAGVCGFHFKDCDNLDIIYEIVKGDSYGKLK